MDDYLNAPPLRVSIIVEWANTRLNGENRAELVLAEVCRQWQAVEDGKVPPTVTRDVSRFLDRLYPHLDLQILSGWRVAPDLEARLRKQVPETCDLRVRVSEGLEYYPLKNLGAAEATGDLLLFLDSDVLPDEGWVAHLLGCFADSDVEVVVGQTYVEPSGPYAAAFALGWTYDLRDRTAGLIRPDKIYANNIAIRAELFRRVGFHVEGPGSRGASSRFLEDLKRMGVPVWENRRAGAAHPPPANFAHLVVRALAHGRDQYFKVSRRRSLAALRRPLRIALTRLGSGLERTRTDWRRVGLSAWEIPVVGLIMAVYYGFFALGGLLTAAAPETMARHFRV